MTYKLGIHIRFTEHLASRFKSFNVLETCTGGGFTSISLAHYANHVYSFEIDEARMKDAYENAKIAGVDHKITFTNESDKELMLLTYQITFAKIQIPENAGYFHAQWRRAVVDPSKPDHLILDNIKGNGKYVGTFLSWTQLHSGWFGEGEIKWPTITITK